MPRSRPEKERLVPPARRAASRPGNETEREREGEKEWLLRSPGAAQRVALRGAVRCRTGAPVFSAATGVPGLRSARETKHSSLPGLTRQSIPFVRLLRIAM